MSTPILISLGDIHPTTPFSQDVFFGIGGVTQTQDGEIIAETQIAGLFPCTVDSVTLQDPTEFSFVSATIDGVVQALPFAVAPNTTVTFNFTRTSTDSDPIRFQATVLIN